MEYQQITLTDWVEMKKKLERELLGVKHSFVRIGYLLRRMDDEKMYEMDGFKSIAEFAKEKYGLEASTTSRFMRINKEYSVDGYSEILRPRYEAFGRSQLEEMLQLPESDRDMITPKATRESIRDLKRFNNAGPEDKGATNLDMTIEAFLKANPEMMAEIETVADPEVSAQCVAAVKEIIIPSGNRSYKNGLYFLMFYEDKISFKKILLQPQEIRWDDFVDKMLGIMLTIEAEKPTDVDKVQKTEEEELAADIKEDVEEVEEPEETEEPEDFTVTDTDEEGEEFSVTDATCEEEAPKEEHEIVTRCPEEEPKETVAPAQIIQEIQEERDDFEVDPVETIETAPLPPIPGVLRIEYIRGLTPMEAAKYFTEMYGTGEINNDVLKCERMMQFFFLEEVDEETGQAMEVEHDIEI